MIECNTPPWERDLTRAGALFTPRAMPTDIPHSVSEEHPVSDVTLLEQVAEGDVRALWELSVRHSSSLRALALGILRDPVVAEQVVQATFREVRYEAARFDPSHFPVFGWLAELTRVSALQRARAGVPSIFA